MRFLSTRGSSTAANASEAIVKGLASDGGLFVPEIFPDLSLRIRDMLDMDYAERASTVIGAFLDEFDKAELLKACKDAYSRFEDDDAAPLVKIDDDLFILELFHGPTLAFKDVALTLLPYLMRKSADICGVSQDILILVATSGDTGKAALEGFKNKDGIKVCVFYPTDGVSDVQKLQMCTQDGDNVCVVGVKGNFDDCQTAVKNIFGSDTFADFALNKGYILSSANSINFGRLVPQIAYYFSAYCDLVNADEIKSGDKVDFCVPTGNFGNILAGYYAKKMGLPIGCLICASNQNNVLTEFFNNGKYDTNRKFYKTISPSMDILVSSNLERLLFEVSGRDAEVTAKRMGELRQNGLYKVSSKEKAFLNEAFFAGYASDALCCEKIKEMFDDFGYLCDTHTAVALAVSDLYGEDNGRETPLVVLSTASPYKFSQSILKAIDGTTIADAFKASKAIYDMSAMPVPDALLSLKSKKILFNRAVLPDELESTIKDFLV